jgi:hypothetical protein
MFLEFGIETDCSESTVVFVSIFITPVTRGADVEDGGVPSGDGSAGGARRWHCRCFCVRQRERDKRER